MSLPEPSLVLWRCEILTEFREIWWIFCDILAYLTDIFDRDWIKELIGRRLRAYEDRSLLELFCHDRTHGLMVGVMLFHKCWPAHAFVCHVLSLARVFIKVFFHYTNHSPPLFNLLHLNTLRRHGTERRAVILAPLPHVTDHVVQAEFVRPV